MSYTEVTGDLFDLGLPAIGHGCNCRGSMGAGIALLFRTRWPRMHIHYRTLCMQGLFRPGDIFPWDADGIRIYNLATQDQPGAHATIPAITLTVRRMLADAQGLGLPRVGIPRIGAGIGGLNWTEVAAELREVAADTECELVVVSLPHRCSNSCEHAIRATDNHNQSWTGGRQT